MKKINIFLIIITAVLSFTNNINVKAATTQFYEAETIPGVYLNKEKAGITYYLTGKVIRQHNTNQHAYCIEPFVLFNSSAIYTPTFNPNNLTEEQKTKIALISFYGYGYENHTESKWYAITQLMIWKVADPNANYYFTQTLNGKPIEPFNNEINEINNLMYNYTNKIDIDNKHFEIPVNNELNVYHPLLKHYKVTSNNATQENNNIKIKPTTESTQTITLTKVKPQYIKPILYYQSSSSQMLMTPGNIPDINISFTVSSKKTEIKLIKLDKDTENKTPQGEASLSGAIYQLYDKDMKEIKQIAINENNEGILQDINYGEYYIKEIKPGIGYTLNEEIYKISISSNNPTIELIVKNKVIEKEIIINKYYGTTNNFKKESNISFEIFNNKNELIKTITTNEFGTTSIYLPYGVYKVKQVNTTEGYLETDDFNITVNNQAQEIIDLYDYQIPVPNTNKSKKSSIPLISLIICIGLFYDKKNNTNFSNNN